MSRRYKFYEAEGAYFISFATVDWIDVFSREPYFICITDSLDYCRKHKGMEIYGYCIMPSHVHLIFRSSSGNPSSLLRDFKGFTARMMLRMIAENSEESRKNWMLERFRIAGAKHKDQYMQFWQHDNHPIEIWSYKVFEQKLEYTHKNPVVAGYVVDPVDWKYSSARNYGGAEDIVLEIDLT